MRNQRITPKIARPATPPTVPPAIAPILEEEVGESSSILDAFVGIEGNKLVGVVAVVVFMLVELEGDSVACGVEDGVLDVLLTVSIHRTLTLGF